MRAEFAAPVSLAGAFMSDTAPLGDYTIYAFGAGNVLLESFVVSAASFSGVGCDVFPQITGCGVFVGFSRPGADILAVQFGPSAATNDSFAIDDLRFDSGSVPEPGTLALMGLGLLTVARRVRRGRP